MFFILLTFIFLSPLLGFLFVHQQKIQTQILSFFLGIAAGTFASLIIFEAGGELLPFSKASFMALIFLGAGIAANYFLDQLLPANEHHQHHHCQHPAKFCHMTTMTTISLGWHNLIEGIIFGLLAASDIQAASVLSIMIILHNLPLNLALIVPETYVHSSLAHILKHLFFANIPFIVGASSYFFLNQGVSEELLMSGEFFAFGMIIYLLINEIWPITWQEKGKKFACLGASLGIILVILIEFLS
ncbi:MAG: hypothetical protein Q4G02_01210 [bacterium]|nr:hypothetical protein [bacterium]